MSQAQLASHWVVALQVQVSAGQSAGASHAPVAAQQTVPGPQSLAVHTG